MDFRNRKVNFNKNKVHMRNSLNRVRGSTSVDVNICFNTNWHTWNPSNVAEIRVNHIFAGEKGEAVVKPQSNKDIWDVIRFLAYLILFYHKLRILD